MNDKLIKDLKAGDQIISFFVIRKKEIKTRRESNETYLSIELGDATGRINGTLWDRVQEIFNLVELGDIVKVKGKVIHFRDRLHLTIEKIRKAEAHDEVDLRQLVPVVEKDRNQMLAYMDDLIRSVSNPYLNQLLTDIFHDEQIREAFYNAPGGKLWHHNYIGGLLEHTLSVTDIALRVGELYPGINRDLLLTAGLLHDIGKISSYTYQTLIDFTDEGRLLGHIVIGANLVQEKIKGIPGFPKSLANELLHLILSHQGKLEQASPVVPMTLEAIILYYADELDSKANAFLRIAKKEKRPGTKWSSYINLLNRYLYFGSAEG